jgi:hypothetical protein
LIFALAKKLESCPFFLIGNASIKDKVVRNQVGKAIPSPAGPGRIRGSVCRNNPQIESRLGRELVGGRELAGKKKGVIHDLKSMELCLMVREILA